MTREGNEVVGKRTVRFICDVRTHRNRSLHRNTGHRARNIDNSNAILDIITVVVRKILPILLKHQTIRIAQSLTIGFKGTMCNVVRIESTGINLNLSILSESLILSLNHIAASKRIAINYAGTRRNLVELNLVPPILRHKALNDADTLTQSRESLTVLLGSHAEVIAGNHRQMARFFRAGILRLQPLSKQRRSLARDIQSQLMAHQIESVLLQRSANEDIQVVPATVLRHEPEVTTHSFSLVRSEPVGHNAEETTLALAAAHIAQVEQALQSMSFILVKSRLEQSDAICVRASAVCSAKRKQIHKTIQSGLMSNSAILSQGKIGILLHSVHKSIHRINLLLIFSYSLGQGRLNSRPFLFGSVGFNHFPTSAIQWWGGQDSNLRSISDGFTVHFLLLLRSYGANGEIRTHAFTGHTALQAGVLNHLTTFA